MTDPERPTDPTELDPQFDPPSSRRERLSIPEAADVPHWVSDLLQRFDDAEQSRRDQTEETKKFVKKTFDRLSADLLTQMAKMENELRAEDRRIEGIASDTARRVALREKKRDSYKITLAIVAGVALILSIVALVGMLDLRYGSR